VIRERKGILAHKRARDADIFGKGPQVYEQVITKIGLPSATIIALAAGGCVACHDSRPNRKEFHCAACCHYIASKLVTKERGWIIFGVSAPVGFYIGATSQGCIDLDE
jgi:hypothetical protein